MAPTTYPHPLTRRIIGGLLAVALSLSAPASTLALRESQEDAAVGQLRQTLRGGLEESRPRQRTLLLHDDRAARGDVVDYIWAHRDDDSTVIAGILNERFAHVFRDEPQTYRPFVAIDIRQHLRVMTRRLAEGRVLHRLMDPVDSEVVAFVRGRAGFSHPALARALNADFPPLEGQRPLTHKDVNMFRERRGIRSSAQRSRELVPTLLSLKHDGIGARVQAFVQAHPLATHRTLAIVLNFRYRPIIQQRGKSLALEPQEIWGYRKQHHLLQRELQSSRWTQYLLGSLTDDDVAVWVEALNDAGQDPEALTALLEGVWQYRGQSGLPSAIAEVLESLARDHRDSGVGKAALAIREGRLPDDWFTRQRQVDPGSSTRRLARTLLLHPNPAIRERVRSFIERSPWASSSSVASALNLRYGVGLSAPLRSLTGADINGYRWRHQRRPIHQHNYEAVAADFGVLFDALKDAVHTHDTEAVAALIGALNAWDGTLEQREQIIAAFRQLSRHVNPVVRDAARAAWAHPPWLAVSEMAVEELARIQPGVIVRHRELMGSANGTVVSRRDDNHRSVVEVQFPGRKYAFALSSAPLEVKMASLPPAAGLEEGRQDSPLRLFQKFIGTTEPGDAGRVANDILKRFQEGAPDGDELARILTGILAHDPEVLVQFSSHGIREVELPDGTTLHLVDGRTVRRLEPLVEAFALFDQKYTARFQQFQEEVRRRRSATIQGGDGYPVGLEEAIQDSQDAAEVLDLRA